MNDKQEELRLEIEYLAANYKCFIQYNFDFAVDKTEDIYVDVAVHENYFGDRRIDSFYTEHGIRGFDSWYIDQIKKGWPDYTVDEFKTLIINNPHLHKRIKLNLLDNVKAYEQRI